MFDADELLASARSRTGLTDFGDERFLVGLHQFVDGLNATDNIIPGRETELTKLILRLLCNLLWRQEDLAKHPQILEQRLLPPVCIVSLPRTGTTKLQRLLGATGAFQNLLYWYFHMPSRIPGLPEGGREKRIEITEEFCRWRESVSPTINVTHRSFTHEPDEDAFLQQLCFCSAYLAQTHNLPLYNEWFARQDPGFAYDFEKQQLQYLQWQFHRQHPKAWILKSPGHLGQEDQLQRIFPEGSRIICPHREPAEIFPSAIRLGEDFGKLYNRLPMPLEAFSHMVVDLLHSGMEQHMAWRKANPQVEVLDLSFHQICDDSLGTAEKICDFLGLPLTANAKRRIGSWDKANPRHKHGKLELTLEMYGLDEHVINARFGPYRETFGQFL